MLRSPYIIILVNSWRWVWQSIWFFCSSFHISPVARMLAGMKTQNRPKSTLLFLEVQFLSQQIFLWKITGMRQAMKVPVMRQLVRLKLSSKILRKFLLKQRRWKGSPSKYMRNCAQSLRGKCSMQGSPRYLSLSSIINNQIFIMPSSKTHRNDFILKGAKRLHISTTVKAAYDLQSSHPQKRRHLLSSNQNSSSIIPTFNNDGKSYTPAFVLPLMRKTDDHHLEKYNQKVSTHREISENSINIPKPRNKDYCNVCEIRFQDYLKHSLSETHNAKLTRSHYHKMIVSLCGKLTTKKIRKRNRKGTNPHQHNNRPAQEGEGEEQDQHEYQHKQQTNKSSSKSTCLLEQDQ